MEETTTPFPFLSQELDFSHLIFNNMFHDTGNDDAPSKRQKTEDDQFGAKNNNGSNSELMRDALTSLLFIDEAEMEDSGQWAADAQLERSLMDDNHRKTQQVMSDYYSQMDRHYSSELNEVDSARKPAKRARSVVFAAVGEEEEHKSPPRKDSGCSGPARRLWVKDRSKDWWDRVSSPDYPEEDFKKAFRMSRATFDMICDELDAAVTKKNTTLRDAIPVRQRVAVCIWRLATGQPLRLVSKLFGLGISTCHKLILEVCTAIRTVLLPKFVRWPTGDHLHSIKDEFEALSGIPDIGGSMYTTHVPIIAPKVSVAAYYNKRHTERNQKTSYSITVQGVVDRQGIFTDISIGWPGSFSDEHVLENSTLYKKAGTGLFSDLRVAANTSYPLTDWVLVPYSHQNLTWTQDTFNKKMGEVLKVGKEAFCRLKGRWACLQKRTEVKLTDLPYVLGACCVLHNICEMRGEEMSSELKFEVFDDEIVPENNVRSAAAAQARDQIAHNLFHRGHGSAFL